VRCLQIVERTRIERDCPSQEFGGEDPFLIGRECLKCLEEFGGLPAHVFSVSLATARGKPASTLYSGVNGRVSEPTRTLGVTI
jgi:hypothetical protein